MLCMEQRKNVVVAARKKTRHHVTHHVTHVIDDADGSGRGGKGGLVIHAKTIKSPVLPYNKWEPAAPMISSVGGGMNFGAAGAGKGPGGTLSVAMSGGGGGGGGGGPRTDSPIQIQNPYGYGTLSAGDGMAAAVLSAGTSANGAVETEVRMSGIYQTAGKQWQLALTSDLQVRK